MIFDKKRDSLLSLTSNILKSEEIFIEYPTEIKNFKKSLRNILDSCFTLLKKSKTKVEEDSINLEMLKTNIKDYTCDNPDMDSEVYFYAMRNSLKLLIENYENKIDLKSNLFEVIMTVFLFIDFLKYSIDEILIC
ncbi:MAG: hypothetical protein ABIP51_18055 [Bacteroidia bacterium]